ncbi:excinuclease ABC subunit C [Mesorhizobium sp. LSJC255A00]|uniref:excinuclease ABC subunit C n=1 Tax=Mesorhizobium sp. LSJC255A00 TaxID=1287313 RepID=UPI0003CE57E6|nr:excinuclease ABC subunit C [Mesorhizobium sp. LSJC255A00]ESX17699.1 excinuclease ABC subunit C [Mesorhizobium sp. LSJC255A00]
MVLLRSSSFAGQAHLSAKQDGGEDALRSPGKGEHNAGKSSHTSKFLPWRIVTYMAFSNQAKAASFERYLKSGSGHAFANKRLW